MRDRETPRRSDAGRRRRLVAAAGCALVLAVASGGLGTGRAGAVEPPVFPEYQVKAAFLLNFTRYVTWPEAAFKKADEPLVLCILGADPFGEVIDDTVAGRPAGGNRPIQVRRLSRVEDAETCHILFISRAERHHQAALLADLDGRAILTVGESDRFLRDGGAINLLIDQAKHVKFEVNAEATGRAGLKLSLPMVRLARPRAPKKDQEP